MAAQYPPQQTFAKLSLVALYYRIFSSSRKFVLWLYTIGAVQLGWGIGNFIAHWAQCIPIRGFWDPSVPHVCLNDAMLLVVGETINSLLDFMLVGLAIWIVQSLQMSSAVKLKLSVIFALGGLYVLLHLQTCSNPIDIVSLNYANCSLFGQGWSNWVCQDRVWFRTSE